MHAMIQQALYQHPGAGSILETALPCFIQELQGDFVRFADCGAGVGWTARQYTTLLREHLTPDNFAKATIVCYEPLEENLRELEKVLIGREYVLRGVAVGDEPGKMTFSVPLRMEGDNGPWSPGTSYGGFLGELPGAETVSVEVVRLDEDGYGPFDFIKLDLQGGERAALQGATELIRLAKMVYVEHQLVEPHRSTADILQGNDLFPFFDQLQFGMRAGRFEVPLELLEEIGISVTRILLGTGSMPTIMWGAFTKTPPLTPTLTFPDELIGRLYDAGIHYMQTDLLAVAPRYLGVLSRALT